MPAHPLTIHDREEIFRGIALVESCSEIGRRVSRHRSTVAREISRNGGSDGYSPVQAHQRAATQRSRPKVPKLVSDPVLAAEVEARLLAKDSPTRIAIEVASGVGSISHETIYRSIYGRGTMGLSKDVYKTMQRPRRCRKHRNQDPPTSTHPLGVFRPISQRPAIADARTEVGHLEGDLIVGAYNRTALGTIVDRASRKLWLVPMPGGKSADPALEALTAALLRIPKRLRRTLTWDQGSELARHLELGEACGIDIYIADAKSPWQRPTNENGNSLVRRHVGKGTDLSAFTEQQIRTIENKINTIPRRIFNWHTANDIYDALTQ